jgi:hypothetical protein
VLFAGLISLGKTLTCSISLRQVRFVFFGKSSSFKAWGLWSLQLFGVPQLLMACSGRKFLTSHSSGPLRCSGHLIPALGSRAFFFCCCIVCITFWLRAALLRAGLRFCFSHARSFLASRAHWRISHLRARSHARFWQRHFHRQPFVRGAQATTASALPGIQSSSIVSASLWAACCCLTSRPSGRLRRRLTQALAFLSSRTGVL